jgi:hypothetical protein
MGYPELKSDESITLTTQDVKVKTVPFELVLTNKRLIIIDSKKNLVPTQTVPLAAIRNVALGENAIRDPVITLTILTGTADTREMALTFARRAGGERRREAEEWLKILKNQASAAARDAATMPIVPPDQDHAAVSDAAVQDQTGVIASLGIKKKIEVVPPMKTIVDNGYLPPKPVETSSLPGGSFCPRCGNRVPPGSTFCNRCGARVTAAADQIAMPSVQPSLQVVRPADVALGERRERPIEQIIHSIEPLIEDSVPRVEPAHPVPRQSPEPQALQPSAPAEAAVLASSAIGEIPATPAPAEPAMPPIPPVPSRRPRKPRYMAVIAVVIIILAISGVGLLLMHAAPVNSGGSTSLTPTPTPATTTPPTPVPTPPHTPTPVVTVLPTPEITKVLIPSTGVWVEVMYAGTYSGLIGTPGNQGSITGTGDKFYQVSAGAGDSVAVSLQKMDGSGNPMTVTVYINGQSVKTTSTTAPMGTITLTAPVPTPTITSTPPPMPATNHTA